MGMAAFVATGALVFGLTVPASATLPAGTVVKASLKTGTNMVFNGAIDSIPITVTCTKLLGKRQGPVDAIGLGASCRLRPQIAGCTDNSGGTDTITTSGTWKLSETSTTQKLKIPQDGATFTSSVLPGCTVTAAPSGAVKMKGSYNDSNTVTVTNAPIPTSGSGCTSATATTTGTIVEKPAPGPPPF